MFGQLERNVVMLPLLIDYILYIMSCSCQCRNKWTKLLQDLTSNRISSHFVTETIQHLSRYVHVYDLSKHITEKHALCCVTCGT